MSMLQTSTSGRTTETFPRVPTRGVRWRVMASIVGGTAWLVFFLLFVAFVPTGFTLFQSVVVVLASVVAIGGILGGMWASYGMRHPELVKPSD